MVTLRDIAPEICRESGPSRIFPSLQEKSTNNENQTGKGNASEEEICRICHDNPIEMVLITPCSCKGSMSKVHKDCLEQWLAKSSKSSCEVCKFKYNTIRTKKYSGFASFCQWIDDSFTAVDKIYGVMAMIWLLFHLFINANYLISLDERGPHSEEACGQRSLWIGPHWNTGNPLLEFSRDLVCSKDCAPIQPNYHVNVVELILVVLYSVTLFLMIFNYTTSWNLWQQSNWIVRIVPLKEGRMGFPPPPPIPRVRDSVTFVNETTSVIVAARANSRSHGNTRLTNNSARGTAARPEMVSSTDTADNIRIGQAQAASRAANQDVELAMLLSQYVAIIDQGNYWGTVRNPL